MIGQIFSHYKILKKLGEGGMGEVYLAEDMKLHRQVALKFFASHLIKIPEIKERFKREAQTVAVLNHPNIITVYKIDEYQNKFFIAMEYVDGVSLGRLLKEKSLSVIESIDYAIQICEGLQEAHQHGIIHRDIKAENLLIDKHNRLKILDFGLAKLRGKTQITKDKALIGTPNYMSPEQTTGEKVDERSDIFAMGIVLYELLAGQLPFSGENDLAILYAIVHTKPDPVEQFKPDLTEDLRNIVDKALEKDKTKRYQTVSEFLQDLHQEKASLEQSQVFAKTKKTRKRLFRNNKRVSWGTGILVVILICAWLISSRFFSGNNQLALKTPSAIVVLPFSIRGNDKYSYLSEGMVDLLGTKLNGAGNLRSVGTRALLGFISKNQGDSSNPKHAQEIANHFNARFYVTGGIFEVGGQASTSLGVTRQTLIAKIKKHQL